eukprot:6474687-Amphidinium_carterae.1
MELFRAEASISVLGIVGRLRLYGLRNLDPESMFWAAVQNAMLTYQLDAQNMLRAGFQIFRAALGPKSQPVNTGKGAAPRLIVDSEDAEALTASLQPTTSCTCSASTSLG